MVRGDSASVREHLQNVPLPALGQPTETGHSIVRDRLPAMRSTVSQRSGEASVLLHLTALEHTFLVA